MLSAGNIVARVAMLIGCYNITIYNILRRYNLRSIKVSATYGNEAETGPLEYSHALTSAVSNCQTLERFRPDDYEPPAIEIRMVYYI